MKYVIFDIDGTLTDTKKVDDKCFMKAFEQTFDISIWNEKWESIKNVTDWGITEEIIIRETGRKPSEEEYELMIFNFITNLHEERDKDITQFNEVSGAKGFFNDLLKVKDIKLGIATGGWEKSARLKLETIGINLEGICFSNSSHHKSREAITRKVINQLGSNTHKTPDQIFYFGDGEWDYKTCIKLGIKFIGIDNDGNGKLSKLGAKTVFQNYNDKDEILTELRKMGQ